MRLSVWDGLVQSSEDINRKFGGTFVFAVCPDIDAEQRVYEIVEVGPGVATIRWSPRAGARHRTDNHQWESIDVIHHYPKTLGAIPFFNKALFIQRNPARQWHVGLTSRNTQLWDHTMRPTRIGMAEAEAVFSPTYEKREVLDAVKELETNKEREAVVLSPQYWLVKREDKVKLYRGRLSLGSFSFGGFFVHKSCGDLRQELWDDLRLKV